VPPWILGLISTTFFGPCPKHGPAGTASAATTATGSGAGGGDKGGGGAETSSAALAPPSTKKADLTHWCCACLRPLCASCIQEREHPAGHRLQQVRRTGRFFSLLEREKKKNRRAFVWERFEAFRLPPPLPPSPFFSFPRHSPPRVSRSPLSIYLSIYLSIFLSLYLSFFLFRVTLSNALWSLLSSLHSPTNTPSQNAPNFQFKLF
jgi:hypothetical protein